MHLTVFAAAPMQPHLAVGFSMSLPMIPVDHLLVLEGAVNYTIDIGAVKLNPTLAAGALKK